MAIQDASELSKYGFYVIVSQHLIIRYICVWGGGAETHGGIPSSSIPVPSTAPGPPPTFEPGCHDFCEASPSLEKLLAALASRPRAAPSIHLKFVTFTCIDNTFIWGEFKHPDVIFLRFQIFL